MLPALLVAAAVAVAGKGVKDGLEAKKMQDEAKSEIEWAKTRCKNAENLAQTSMKETDSALTLLGELQLSIANSFEEFSLLVEKLVEQLNASDIKQGKRRMLPI